ncbi:MAG: GDSL-type esterase/lipase family protein [Alphaproteobacteria bacterium]|nr:GDSL-type esterase/lipase family protein [Alphaproteobacteria bacterium]
MSKPASIFCALSRTGPLIALTAMMVFGTVGPAAAQFFGLPDFGGRRLAPPPRRGWFGGEIFSPPSSMPSQPRTDFSRAPPPAKRDTTPTHNILVLGDSMADWLAFGLEEAYADDPTMGILRRHRANSGLIRYQPRGEPSDWAAAAKGILANEKPDIVVIMLGLNDRISLREPPKPTTDTKGKDAKPPGGAEAEAKPEDKPVDAEAGQDDAEGETPQIAVPERSRNGVFEFRDERWAELYGKKIAEMISVLKTKGVPVLWVGLPAIRGPKGTAEILYLDNLYREGAAKAGITYVDVWDGFVDEAGRFLQKGPDLEGQIRQLRSADGVYFTKPGARKLAHYVQREVARLLADHSDPIAPLVEATQPERNAAPDAGQTGPGGARPLAGPVLPLVAATISTDQLLGGPNSPQAAIDPLTARTLMKGEALTPSAGRADDYSWPRREVGREQATADSPVALATPTSPAAAGSAAAANPAQPPPPRLRRPAAQRPASGPPPYRNFFRF